MWSIIRDNVLCMHAILQALSSYQEKEPSRYQHMECSRTSHGETAEDDDGRGERMKAAYLSSFPSSSSSFSSLSPHPSLKEVSISTGDKKDVRVKKRITSPLCNKVIEEGIETQAKEEEELSSFFVEKNKKKQTESSLEKEEEDHRRGEEGEREKLIDRFSSSSSSRRFVKDEELTNERRWKDTREEEEKKRGKEEPQDQREREIEKSPSSHSSTRDRGLFARDSKSATCMILAAQHNARKAFLFIYKKLGKISLTETDENGCTPAHWAAFKGNVEILRLLNYFDSDFTTVDIYGYLALHRAVEARHLDACRVLIEECGVMKNERTAKSNITAIEMARALRPPHPELVDYLQNP
ncbi:dhhc zinc finger domain-containing protein, partial [Cystoisospora suis]